MVFIRPGVSVGDARTKSASVNAVPAGSDTAAAITAAALFANAGRDMAAAAVIRCVAVVAATEAGRATVDERVEPCDVCGGLDRVVRRPLVAGGLAGLWTGAGGALSKVRPGRSRTGLNTDFGTGRALGGDMGTVGSGLGVKNVNGKSTLGGDLTGESVPFNVATAGKSDGGFDRTA